MRNLRRSLPRHLSLIARLGVVAALTGIAGMEASAQSFNGPKPGVIDPGITLTPISLNPNLAWGARQSYALTGPLTHELFLEGLGINDFVDVLDTVQAFTIGRDFSNTSNFAPTAGNYLYSLVIRQMIFRSYNLGGRIITGWVPGPDATHTVFTADEIGPALNPGETFRAEFRDIDPVLDFNSPRDSRCGLYQATLQVDSDDFVAETNEQDNVVRHYFFIPSRQIFNLSVTPHAPVTLRGPGKVATHTFKISGVGSIGPVVVDYRSFSTQGNLNINLETTPAPPVRRTVTPTNPVTIKMFATPIRQGSASGKITVFSEDGCIIKQESAQVNYIPITPPPSIPVGPVFGPSFGPIFNPDIEFQDGADDGVDINSLLQ